MYKIYIVNTPYVKDRILIYDDDVYDESLRLSDPKLHLEVNSAGTLEFSITPDNVGYDKLVPMKTQFIVMRSDSPEKNGTRQRNEIIWFGRALTIDTDIYKVKSIHCEGGLSYLNDVVYRDNSEGTFWNATQPVGVMLYSTWNDMQDNVHHKLRSYDVSGYVYAHTTEGSFELPKAPLRIPGVVFEANDQYKTKYWGLEPIISIDQETQNFFFDQASLSQTNYASTSGILNPDDMTALDLVTGLLDAVGGYYWVSLVETDAPNGLDRIYGMQLHLARTLKEPNENNQSQTIRFGENLTDYTENEDGSSFWTAVHPYGTFKGKDRSSTLTKNQLGCKGTTPIKKLNWHVESAADNYPSIIIVDDLAKEYGIIVKDLDVGTLSMSEQLIGMSINAIDSLKIVERKSGSNSWTNALRDVTITGVDMTFMGADYNMIDLMDSVHIISEPHGVDTYLNVTSIDVDLQRPENSVYVLNGTLEKNMAESNGYSGSSSGSSSGSGGGYTHPRYTEHALDLYKVANDSLGHVSSVDKVTKEDLFALGVPSRNTTYDLTKKDGKIILRSDLGNEYPVNDDDTKYTLSKTGDTIKMEGTDGSVSEVEVSGGTDTTYSLSKTGDKITLIGSDGSSSSVVDSDTTYNDATQSTHGLMTAADKKKLDGMDAMITNSAVWIAGANNAAKWYRLGVLVSSGNFSNAVIRVWSGDGANGRANQNSSFEIQIKDGWQSTQSATKACGVTVYRINCSGVKVKVIPTAHDTYTVWAYLPWAYWNGNYAVYGKYKSWTSQRLIQSDEPEGTAADTAYYDQAFLTSTVAKATEATTLTDSGWVTCPLAVTGNTTYPSSSSVIKVRKYGKLVRLEASVNYKTAFGTDHNVATIPEGYRPSTIQREHGIIPTATEKIMFDALLLDTGNLSFIPAGSNSSTFNPANLYQCSMTYFID